jgi:hypothetical protein
VPASVSRTAVAALLVFLSAAAFGRPPVQATAQQRAIIDLEHRWLSSEDDPSALESILADDFVHVLASGPITKAEQLQFMREHPPARGAERHLQDLRVRIYGTAAVANGSVVATTQDGKIQKTIFTDVFAYRNGRWQAVNAQEQPLAR